MIILRDLAGNVHYVRNGKIDIVTNMTKEYSRYVFDIGVAYREDVDEVIEVIKAVDEELRSDPDFTNDILEPIEILGLDQFADSAIIIKARTKTMPIQQWKVAREFNRRLKKDRRPLSGYRQRWKVSMAASNNKACEQQRFSENNYWSVFSTGC
jgi:small conductance mechanosensitive channel